MSSAQRPLAASRAISWHNCNWARGGPGRVSRPRHSDLQTFPRLGLEDLEFRVAGADLLLEPVARAFFAVAQQNRARGDLADELEQLLTVGMGGQIEVLHFTA